MQYVRVGSWESACKPLLCGYCINKITKNMLYVICPYVGVSTDFYRIGHSKAQ